MTLWWILGGIALLALVILGSKKAWSNMDQTTRVELNNLYYGDEFSVEDADKPENEENK